MEDKKIIFALDIGTRSVVGIVGALKDGCFNVLDFEQEFHEKRAMRDGQIEDIDLVARVANSVKTKLQERSGQTFTKVSIAAAGRALKTVSASFSYDLIPNEPITEKIVQYMEYSAIEKAQESFMEPASSGEEDCKNYYCVGYSVTDYLLDDYKIKNLEAQKGVKAVANIIAAFLPSSVLISLYAVTARCGLEVDNLTLEPIAAIHAVVPDDVRFLNIALVDIGGGTSDLAISRDGSVVAYDMVTIAGDEITESLMQHYLTNFATAERIKLSMSGEEKIQFKDILGNHLVLTPDEAFASVTEPINSLAEALSQRILLINGSPPAAVFLVGGGSQIRGLCKIVADKLGMQPARVAIGVANTDSNLSLFSEHLYNPTFVTPIGIGIVSSLYRGCDFFAISVNGKRIMLFNHQSIKVIDALMLSGIKPSSLIGLTAPNLMYTLNGVKKTLKGSHGVPGEIMVNNSPANIETEIKQGDEIAVILAHNGVPISLTLIDALSEFDLNTVDSVHINGVKIDCHDLNFMKNRKVEYMDNITVILKDKSSTDFDNVRAAETATNCTADTFTYAGGQAPAASKFDSPTVEINKIYSHQMDPSSVSLLLADDEPAAKVEISTRLVPEAKHEIPVKHEMPEQTPQDDPPPASIDVTLNGSPVTLVQETKEPLILMHLLKYVDLDVSNSRGELILKINGEDANYADPLNHRDVAVIKWSEDL